MENKWAGGGGIKTKVKKNHLKKENKKQQIKFEKANTRAYYTLIMIS